VVGSARWAITRSSPTANATVEGSDHRVTGLSAAPSGNITTPPSPANTVSVVIARGTVDEDITVGTAVVDDEPVVDVGTLWVVETAASVAAGSDIAVPHAATSTTINHTAVRPASELSSRDTTKPIVAHRRPSHQIKQKPAGYGGSGRGGRSGLRNLLRWGGLSGSIRYPNPWMTT